HDTGNNFTGIFLGLIVNTQHHYAPTISDYNVRCGSYTPFIVVLPSFVTSVKLLDHRSYFIVPLSGVLPIIAFRDDHAIVTIDPAFIYVAWLLLIATTVYRYLHRIVICSQRGAHATNINCDLRFVAPHILPTSNFAALVGTGIGSLLSVRCRPLCHPFISSLHPVHCSFPWCSSHNRSPNKGTARGTVG
ncbi:hypothetical protein BGX33_002929, partial [Mortierella sp. NVP41]